MQRMVALGCRGDGVVGTGRGPLRRKRERARGGQVTSAIHGRRRSHGECLPAKYLTRQLSHKQRAPDAAPELRVGHIQDLIDNHDTAGAIYTTALGDVAQSSSCGTSRRARSPKEWAELQRRRPKLQLVRGCGPLPLLVQRPPTELPRPGLRPASCARQRTRRSPFLFRFEGNEAFPINDFTNHVLVQTQTRQRVAKTTRTTFADQSFGPAVPVQAATLLETAAAPPLRRQLHGRRDRLPSAHWLYGRLAVLCARAIGCHGVRPRRTHSRPIPKVGFHTAGSLGDSVACSDSRVPAVAFPIAA